MADDILSGHPRTLAMHQDWQMRDIARTDLALSKPGVNMNALRSTTVVRARKNGDFQIEAFTNMETGVGMWFSALNFSACREGDTVIYAYVDEVPIVLGRMPDVTIPWMVPNNSMQDTLFFEEFDHGSASTGNIGLYRWQLNFAGTGTWGVGGGDYIHPGVIILQTGTTLGGYAQIITPQSWGMPLESLDSVGWMVWNVNNGGGGTGAPVQIFPAVIDNAASPQNYVGFLNNQFAANQNWSFSMNSTSPAVSASIDTGIPCVDGHWYRMMIKRIGAGEWAGYIADLNDKIDSVSILRGAPLVANVFPSLRCYPLITTSARTTYLDYVWWARKGIPR